MPLIHLNCLPHPIQIVNLIATLPVTKQVCRHFLTQPHRQGALTNFMIQQYFSQVFFH